MHVSASNRSRRDLLKLAAAACTGGVGLLQGAAAGKITASQVVDRIKQKVGVPWREQTVDRIVAGDPNTEVRGIATTMMATFEVLKRASAAGRNMIITHEPTYYGHQDTVDQLGDDATYKAKAEFIRANQMAVFRFHDHWHAYRPDGIATGMAKEIGWDKFIDGENPRVFKLNPAMSLEAIAKHIATRLNAKTVRVVGDPKLSVQRARASWGYTSQFPGIPQFGKDDIDLMIIGEAREWEVIEYAQDAITAGAKKALIVIGHVASEQAGMKHCAEWLKPHIPEVPVEFIASAEPFWRP